jgi:predicted RNase H-like nuclease
VKYIGIDGCKKGWFLVSLSESHWNIEIIENINQLNEHVDEEDIVLIDIPIGLQKSALVERKCDLQSRKLLGPKRGSSVFVVPLEQAIYCNTYKEGSLINRNITGRSLSKQTWGIVPKIREVDIYLKDEHKPNRILFESHPELAFWSLNNYQSLQYNKKYSEGLSERLLILENHEKEANKIYETAMSKFLRRDLARDDILDAICLAVLARYKHLNKVKFLPAEGEKNHNGIEMNIHYFG